MEISHKLGYLKTIDFEAFYENTREIERMLSSFTRKLHEPQS
jgi:hypothetical protein